MLGRIVLDELLWDIVRLELRYPGLHIIAERKGRTPAMDGVYDVGVHAGDGSFIGRVRLPVMFRGATQASDIATLDLPITLDLEAASVDPGFFRPGRRGH